MRSLASRCRSQFPSKDRSRGHRYFHEGRVEIREGLDGASARVRGSGSRSYGVYLGWDSSEVLVVRCECPWFGKTGRCKHLWASILAADAEVEVPADLRFEVVEADPSEVPEDLDLEPWDGAFVPGAPVPPATAAPRAGSWPYLLQSIRSTLATHTDGTHTERLAGGSARRIEVYYVLDVESCLSAGGLAIALYQRIERQDGKLGVTRALSLRDGIEPRVPAVDREWIQTLSAIGVRRRGFDPRYRFGELQGVYDETLSRPVIAPGAWELILPRLAATGRLLSWARRRGEKRPDPAKTLAWDDGLPWRFRLQIAAGPEDAGDQPATIRGLLERDGEERPLSDPELLLAQGLVVFPGRIARLDAEEHFPWISRLRRAGEIELPRDELREAVLALHELPRLPPLSLPRGTEIRREAGSLVPRMVIDRLGRLGHSFLRGRVTFLYGDTVLAPEDGRTAVHDGGRLLERDLDAERTALEELQELGLRKLESGGSLCLLFPEGDLLTAVRRLLASGWRVEADGRRVRGAGTPRLTVESRIDWFEVRGAVDFDGFEVPFPELLRAARQGAGTVQLGDGSSGLLPEEWLRRWGGLARLAQGETDGGLRFERSQGFLLDLLLAELPEVDLDAAFERYRNRLDSLRQVSPAAEPRGFRGELRPYQHHGLGWIRRLAEAGMGGCLADDMGLGKTVQALAWLQWRRARPTPAAEKRPSLVVAPKSLVFNWAREADRFAPRLRVASYVGADRAGLLPHVADRDLVLTTYDTLWRDIEELRKVPFDTVFLDEAQAIKNPETQRAKACRLLDARNRFALTGTPVENHLGDLWSIFEFLNPGLLGRLGRRNLARKTPSADREQIEKLSRALAPFILRRTKEKVADDLPRKTEQVLHCQLSARERRLYDEVKIRFQAQIAGHLEERGLARSKIHVLEALLRLRQAACHVGLVDPARAGEGSAKVDLLIEQVEEVVAAGHKALVFSQFTKLLGIVRQRLEGAGVRYEYLDGRTRNRAARVDRFQDDPECSVFLVSLKAGGVGLNLTAAEYVYILDPWWNPAVESQAIDRTHRIGQTRAVFAYRLISRETVEEKVLLLQERKRELAEAVVGGGEKGFVGGLTREDLEVLLG